MDVYEAVRTRLTVRRFKPDPVPDALVRERRTRSQGGLSATARRRNVAGAFAMVFGPPAVVINTYLRLADYAAIGLAFIGAVHWGLAMAAGSQGKSVGWARYMFSVLPAA